MSAEGWPTCWKCEGDASIGYKQPDGALWCARCNFEQTDWRYWKARAERAEAALRDVCAQYPSAKGAPTDNRSVPGVATLARAHEALARIGSAVQRRHGGKTRFTQKRVSSQTCGLSARRLLQRCWTGWTTGRTTSDAHRLHRLLRTTMA